MDLFQAMSVYVKVVETGSMTAAAHASGMSTTMVGNHLRALEQRLGVSLLKRTTRKQSLTEFGGQYYQRCLEVLGLVADSEQLAEQAHSDVPKGTLRITAPPAFGTERLAPALSEFSQRYPLIKLYVVLSNQRMDLVDSGFDVAIRLGELEPSSLIARPRRTTPSPRAPRRITWRDAARRKRPRICNNTTAWPSPTHPATIGVTPTNCGA